MKALALTLAVLAMPIQAAELPECRDLANKFLQEKADAGLEYGGMRPLPDAFMINFTSKSGLYRVTMLFTTEPDAYSPKEDARVVDEGYCNNEGVKTYWGIAETSDSQAKAGN